MSLTEEEVLDWMMMIFKRQFESCHHQGLYFAHVPGHVRRALDREVDLIRRLYLQISEDEDLALSKIDWYEQSALFSVLNDRKNKKQCA
jgi:hypothetical protein